MFYSISAFFAAISKAVVIHVSKAKSVVLHQRGVPQKPVMKLAEPELQYFRCETLQHGCWTMVLWNRIIIDTPS